MALAMVAAAGVRAGTRLAPELKPGARVQVKLESRRDGTLVAEEIEIESDGDRDEELRGDIEGLDAAAGRLRVLGFEVAVTARTAIVHEGGGAGSPAALAPGLRVKIEGERRGELFVAEEITIRRNQGYRERKVEGPIEALDARGDHGVLRVVGLEILVTESTELSGGGRRHAILSRRVGVVDDDDLLFLRPSGLGRHLALAGEVRLRAEGSDNLELDPDDGERELVPEIAAVLGLAASFGPAFLYAEAVGEKEFVLQSADTFEDGASDLRIGEAYVEWRGLGAPWFSVAVGRQKFDEPREWYYSRQNLDAVRAVFGWARLRLEASWSRNLFDKHRNLRDRTRDNVILYARYDALQALAVEGFWVRRRDRTELRDSPRILGLRLAGEAGPHLEFWLDAAREGGTRGRRDPDSGRIVVRPVRARALDGGLIWRWRTRLDPSLVVSYAVGSGEPDEVLQNGDPDAQAGLADRTFRQSGLHRNRDRYTGVVSFRYYGEVLDPELSNLRILTLGVGLHPSRAISLDLLHHRYRQDAPSRFLQSDLDAAPSGEDPGLGSEWHLVAGYEPGRFLELRWTAGRFRPGPAFGDEAKAASVWRFQARFRF